MTRRDGMQDAEPAGKMRTARFWLYRGREDNPYKVFDFHQSRGRDGPGEFLDSFSRPRGGRCLWGTQRSLSGST